MTADELAPYDVVWTTPSADATGSMPIGNGDLAANVWVEPNGDLLLLVSKSDAWDENASLLKLGRVRLRCHPPLDPAVSFSQKLKLSDATLTVVAGDIRLCIWADAHRPVIRIQASSPQPVAIELIVETWRDYPYRLAPTQTGDLFKNLTGPDPYLSMVSSDRVVRDLDEIWVWHFNRLREPDPFIVNMKLQGLGGMLGATPSPLTGRAFGMAVRMLGDEENVRGGPRSICSRPSTEHQIEIFGLTIQAKDELDWQIAMRRLVSDPGNDAPLWHPDHAEWWRTFWDRSTLRIASTADGENAFTITRAYLLQRYMNACAGRGAQPIKFNGSLFSVGRPWDPDFRRWGGPGFWFQNMRLIYWPMLADGDFDLMRPWLQMYRDCLPLQQHRTKTYYGHDGAHYPETMTFWGSEVSGHYGWTPFEDRKQPEAECAYLTFYWSGGIELALVLCEFVEHHADAFGVEALRSIAESVLTFYEQHYPREADGTIRFEPAAALETWHVATNPMPEIAGLRYVTARLLALDDDVLTPAIREQCERIAAVLPPLPIGERDGQTVLLPADKFDVKKNTENPELYCIFPYRLFGVGKPHLDLALRTFACRLNVEHTCWHQDALQMALLGLTDAAKDFVTRRASPSCSSDSRFPAFWNAFHDWNPDMDHGGVLQLAVQNMLVQCEGKTIRLLPAWPSDWDADFKFHLPGPAVIEGHVREGKMQSFTIDPPERRADVLPA